MGVISILVAAAAALQGDIAWEREYRSALQKAKLTGMPMVLLFGVGSNGASC